MFKKYIYVIVNYHKIVLCSSLEVVALNLVCPDHIVAVKTVKTVQNLATAALLLI